jgi:tripartite-type tricarboxylate transporter receptor subunit TctC
MLLTRREAICGFGGGLALLSGSRARAEAAYPSRTIKMIVPYPAGGTTDFLGRLVADQLTTGLGATVVVENKPGAGTTLGAELVARAEPDGYTLLMATSTTLAINKTLYRKLPYDPVRDFMPIALVAGVPFTLIVNPTIPAKTLSEFIAYAKTRPGWSMAPPAMAVRSISAPKCSRPPPESISGTLPTAAACRRCLM